MAPYPPPRRKHHAPRDVGGSHRRHLWIFHLRRVFFSTGFASTAESFIWGSWVVSIIASVLFLVGLWKAATPLPPGVAATSWPSMGVRTTAIALFIIENPMNFLDALEVSFVFGTGSYESTPPPGISLVMHLIVTTLTLMLLIVLFNMARQLLRRVPDRRTQRLASVASWCIVVSLVVDVILFAISHFELLPFELISDIEVPTGIAMVVGSVLSIILLVQIRRRLTQAIQLREALNAAEIA